MIKTLELAIIKSKKLTSLLLLSVVVGVLSLVGVNNSGTADSKLSNDDKDTKNKKNGLIPFAYADTPHGSFGGDGGCGGCGCGGGGGGGGCCFPPTAVIQTPIEPVEISQLNVGDKVVAYDYVQKEFTTSTVENVLTHDGIDDVGHDFTVAPLLQLQYAGDNVTGKMVITSNHPVYDVTSTSFKAAAQFAVGDQLLTPAGVVSVSDIQVLVENDYLDASKVVYNLTLTNGPATYIADGVVVHNKGGAGGSDCI